MDQGDNIGWGSSTLIITKRVDWKSDGLDAGSKNELLDWNDGRPVIPTKGEVFRNRTYTRHYLSIKAGSIITYTYEIR